MSAHDTYNKKPWLKSYGEGVPASIEYENTKLSEYLDNTVNKFPDKTALIFQGFRLNYRQLGDMVSRFASFLSENHIKKGDRVAILLPNTIPCVAAFHAAMKVGAIPVMNNPLYTDAELMHQFNDSGSKLLVTLDLLGNRMIGLREKTGIRKIIYTSIGDYLPFPKNLLFPLVAKKKKLKADVKPAPEIYKWKEVIDSFEPFQGHVDTDMDDVAMLQYTGGTTGVSKGVMLTHRNLSCQVQQMGSWFPAMSHGEETILGAMPFFHIAGLTCIMNFSIAMAWTTILIPKPVPEVLLEAIRKFKPTLAPMVPTMYIGVLNHPDIEKTDLSFIKGSFSGSAPLPVEVTREFEKRSGSVIVEVYGLTETSPVTHGNPFSGGERKVGSVGIPLPDTEAKIVDMNDNTKTVPPGEPGELLVKGPQVMKGYYENPLETENVFLGDWLKTGDIARMDDDGYFYIIDRIKDMIITSGCNVYPRDIDEVLFTHPMVLDACSIGIPHDRRGEAVKSFVVLKEGCKEDAGELISHCGKTLAKYKLPIEIEFRKDLPKTLVGKTSRKTLKQEESKKREQSRL